MFNKNKTMHKKGLEMGFIENHNTIISILETIQKIHRPEAFLDLEQTAQASALQSPRLKCTPWYGCEADCNDLMPGRKWRKP